MERVDDMGRDEAAAAIEWLVEMGADEVVGDEPVNRFTPELSSQPRIAVRGLNETSRSGDAVSDAKAIAAIESTARCLGLGLTTVINVTNPDTIYLAGEITTAWDLMESIVREALVKRALTKAAASTPLRVTATHEYPRLRGAMALIAAPTFAAPRVA